MADSSQKALSELGRYLLDREYHFTTITPESHRRVLERSEEKTDPRTSELKVLRDLFGWSKSVPAHKVDARVTELLEKSCLLVHEIGTVKSRVRFSTLGRLIFAHSSYPTVDADSVFFGPDTYRFVRFIKDVIPAANGIADLGCGSGAGGIALAHELTERGSFSGSLYLGDINETALAYANANALVNGLEGVQTIKSDLLQQIPQKANVVIANPPFIIDEALRTYRHGGGVYGSELSLRMVEAALDYLRTGGHLALYTGACVVDGEDVFFRAVRALLNKRLGSSAKFHYQELDPDIFGEELSRAQYADVDRIAAVGLVVEV